MALNQVHNLQRENIGYVNIVYKINIERLAIDKKKDKNSSKVGDKEVVNRSRVQVSTQIIMLLYVSFSNKLGNSMPLGPHNRISRLEKNKISSKVCINEQ